MNKIKNSLTIGAIIVIIGAIIAISTFDKIKLGCDYVRGYFREFSEKNSSYTLLDNQLYKRHITTYNTSNDDFLYCAGILLYKPQKPSAKLSMLAHKTIVQTEYYSLRRYKKALKHANGIKTKKIKSHFRTLFVPTPLPGQKIDIQNYSRPVIPKTVGLYLTGNTTGSVNIFPKMTTFKQMGVNCVVFDAKDVMGIVNYKSSIPEMASYKTDKKSTIDNLPLLLRTFKEKGFYVIARLAVFRDLLLAKTRPNLAIRSGTTNGYWNAQGEIWCDPTNKRVQDYNINLARELARYGVDEIQFDYIRFPTVGNLSDAKYAYNFGKMQKSKTITAFLKRAYKDLKKYNVNVSIDIFGVVAWGKGVDIRKTGQDIALLSKYCDVISPMLYPSHFNDDFDGFTNPGDHPYEFIYRGCKKVLALAKNRVVVRPWLQAFPWRVTNYGKNYIIKQMKASDDSKSYGFLFWNSRNRYSVVYNALKEYGTKAAHKQ